LSNGEENVRMLEREEGARVMRLEWAGEAASSGAAVIKRGGKRGRHTTTRPRRYLISRNVIIAARSFSLV
jgi:hypothetical protein